MSDKNPIESRRKLLKSIAAGSGAIVAGKSLPESWSRPVVDSVMLPAHAATSTNCSVVITDSVMFVQSPSNTPSAIQICFNTEWCMTGTVDSSGVITITAGIAPGCSGPAATLTGGQIVGWPNPTGVVNGTMNISNWVCGGGTITCTSFTGSFGVFNVAVGNQITLSGETRWVGSTDCCDRVWQSPP